MTVKPYVSRSLRARIFARDGYSCVYCGATEDLTIDHLVSRALGGTNQLDNLQTLCRTCNEAKGHHLDQPLVFG